MNPYFYELQVADRRAQLHDTARRVAIARLARRLRRSGRRDARVAADPVPEATSLRVVATAPAAAASPVPGLAARPTPFEGWAA